MIMSFLEAIMSEDDTMDTVEGTKRGFGSVTTWKLGILGSRIPEFLYKTQTFL